MQHRHAVSPSVSDQDLQSSSNHPWTPYIYTPCLFLFPPVASGFKSGDQSNQGLHCAASAAERRVANWLSAGWLQVSLSHTSSYSGANRPRPRYLLAIETFFFHLRSSFGLALAPPHLSTLLLTLACSVPASTSLYLPNPRLVSPSFLSTPCGTSSCELPHRSHPRSCPLQPLLQV